jgi:hypothetical protein
VKYLYCYDRYSSTSVYRYEVTRETESNIWIKTSNGEIQISKKTYRIGSGWDATRYYNETPELRKEYQSSKLRRQYASKLIELQKCTDESVMRLVVDIKIKREGV